MNTGSPLSGTPHRQGSPFGNTLQTDRGVFRELVEQGRSAYSPGGSTTYATLVVLLVYTQFENHVLNPVIMSRTVKINPLLVLVSILVAASIGSWIGGTLGGFVAALLAIPVASSIQVIVREVWTATAPVDHLDLER